MKEERRGEENNINKKMANTIQETQSASPIPQCDYVLVKSKRKGERCHKMSTRKLGEKNYCVYHFRMQKEKEGSQQQQQQPFAQKKMQDSDTTQPFIPLSLDNGTDYKLEENRKRKRPTYNAQHSRKDSDDDDSDSESEEEIENGYQMDASLSGIWRPDYTIDFDKLEKLCFNKWQQGQRK